jgi:hypothetical protein
VIDRHLVDSLWPRLNGVAFSMLRFIAAVHASDHDLSDDAGGLPCDCAAAFQGMP